MIDYGFTSNIDTMRDPFLGRTTCTFILDCLYFLKVYSGFSDTRLSILMINIDKRYRLYGFKFSE